MILNGKFIQDTKTRKLQADKMKGPFSIWSLFGVTLWIDLISYVSAYAKGSGSRRINPNRPHREVTVIIPAHLEMEHIAETIEGVYAEDYKVKSVIVCGDKASSGMIPYVTKLQKKYKNLFYIESPHNSKASKINYVVKSLGKGLGEFVYIRDARVIGEHDCIEKMVSYMTTKDVAAVTSYGRLAVPKNFLSRSYHYGKTWINELGRFRKHAQELRNALFVICGASTMYRTEVLQKVPIPHKSKTEDTYYTWLLQMKGYKLRVADDATVSAVDVDGKGLDGIKGQIKQSYRWSTGTMQCLLWQVKNIKAHRKLFWTTIIPGFLEGLMYSLTILLAPIFIFITPHIVLGFIIGDTVFSLIGTLIIMPRKFWKTLIHYPQICFFKIVNSIIFLTAVYVVVKQAVKGETNLWTNEWIPPATTAASESFG